MNVRDVSEYQLPGRLRSNTISELTAGTAEGGSALRKRFGGRLDRLDSERHSAPAVRPPGPGSRGVAFMKLVWSQPSVPHARPRSLVPLAVLCIFLGGVFSDRPGIGD